MIEILNYDQIFFLKFCKHQMIKLKVRKLQQLSTHVFSIKFKSNSFAIYTYPKKRF
jgi:hypothetical protein